MNPIKNYIKIATLALFLSISGYTAFLYVKNKELEKNYLISNNNYKASINKNLQYQLRLDQLNDKIAESDSLLKANNIKKKNVKGIGKIKVVYEKGDTVYLPGKVFVENVNIDTTLYDKGYELHLKLQSPNKIIVNPKFEDDIYIVPNVKKEFVGKRSKIFFVRWFQKKQEVVEVKVINRNKFATIKEQTFIEVVK